MKELPKVLAEAAAKAPFYSTDSRVFESGAIFIALKGQNGDGHDFVEAILKKNPSAVVVSNHYAGNDPRLIKVEDTGLAHRQIAALFRKKFKGKVVAVGGSNGKTSTKDFLVTLLGEKFQIVKTDKSQNGELGIPKTLEKLRDGIEIAVIEVGIDAPGDMIRHAELVSPDIAILTSIGEEHLNQLKTVENVFNEEKILFDVALKRGGRAFAPAADVWLARLHGTPNIEFVPGTWPAGLTLPTNLKDPYAKQNARLAVAVAESRGLNADEMQRGLQKLSLPEGRGEERWLRKDLLIVAGHYNANPSSMRAGLENASRLASTQGLGLRLILGDMFDLGGESERAHQDLLTHIFNSCPSEILLVGKEMVQLAQECKKRISAVHTAKDAKLAAPLAAAMSKRSGIIFLKGSRGMALEHCLQAIERENPGSLSIQK